MNDDKVFVGPDGKTWRRVYTVPQMSVDTQLDPRNKDQFVRRTEKYKTLGDHIDKSRELSEIRAQKDGIDGVKQAYFDQYNKERGGNKPHPASLPKKIENSRVTVELD